jgi:tRNA pseudouridine32 synthase/23S rRNA pseudouridine746 synthase
LALTPLTGRTHQLRVHCAAKGWPILGDSIYGSGGETRLQLHARTIEIPLYKNKTPVRVEAPVPDHVRAALEVCGLFPDVIGDNGRVTRNQTLINGQIPD